MKIIATVIESDVEAWNAHCEKTKLGSPIRPEFRFRALWTSPDGVRLYGDFGASKAEALENLRRQVNKWLSGQYMRTMELSELEL